MGGGNSVSGSGRGFHQHFRIPELGNVFGDRIIQQEIALFVEHHHGQAGDGFAHGADAEDGIRRHGLGRFAVLHPLGFEPRDLAAARHESHSASDAFFVDAALDKS